MLATDDRTSALKGFGGIHGQLISVSFNTFNDYPSLNLSSAETTTMKQFTFSFHFDTGRQREEFKTWATEVSATLKPAPTEIHMGYVDFALFFSVEASTQLDAAAIQSSLRRQIASSPFSQYRYHTTDPVFDE